MSAETRSNPPAHAATTAAEGSVPSPDAGANRRAFHRLKPTEVGGLEAARLTSGAEIKLIDLSKGGAQFESDRRFLPNATVSLRLVTRDSAFVVHGRVVRSRIVRLASGGLGYNVAVAFNEVLDDLITEPAAGQPADTAEPAEPPATPEEALEAAPSESADIISLPSQSEVGAGVTAEEGAAFEAAASHAPTMLTVTAAVDSSGEELLDMFNGNDW